jgi:universal stress protein E
MNRFKKILFVNEPGVDSATTAQGAVNLARANKAELTLCDVAQELPASIENLEQTFKQIRLEKLHTTLEDIDCSNVNINFKTLEGTAFIEVIREIKHGGYHLLIKNAEPSGLFEGHFGSNDMHLLRKSPCPVWITKSPALKGYKSIVAAVDIDPSVETNSELNEFVMDLAITLARESNSELHVVHAWNFVHEPMLRDKRFRLSGNKLDEMVARTRVFHEEKLQQLLAQHDLSGVDYTLHLGKDQASSYILATAEKVGAELIVMGTVSRTGIPGFFIGNTAERVLSATRASVLTVKPRAFATPVI